MPIEKLKEIVDDISPDARFVLLNEKETIVFDIQRKINQIIDWINDHEKLTLPRFKSELLQLIKEDWDLKTLIHSIAQGMTFEPGDVKSWEKDKFLELFKDEDVRKALLLTMSPLVDHLILETGAPAKAAYLQAAEEALEEAIESVLPLAYWKVYFKDEGNNENRERLRQAYEKWKELKNG